LHILNSFTPLLFDLAGELADQVELSEAGHDDLLAHLQNHLTKGRVHLGKLQDSSQKALDAPQCQFRVDGCELQAGQNA
jgi:hypothetical protein